MAGLYTVTQWAHLIADTYVKSDIDVHLCRIKIWNTLAFGVEWGLHLFNPQLSSNNVKRVSQLYSIKI